MALDIPVRSEWQRQLVATRCREGHTYLLVGVRKSTCDACRYGTRVDTFWGSPTGRSYRINWCTSCFDAECIPVELEEAVRPLLSSLIREVSQEPPRTYWNGARAAIADLEQRGLLSAAEPIGCQRGPTASSGCLLCPQTRCAEPDPTRGCRCCCPGYRPA